MKNINVILKFVFCLISMVLGVAVAKGQVYKLGDLYTFEDGTKGVVFYVNPDDPTTGTVAALNDLDGQFALWSGVKPQALAEIFTPFGGISFRNIAGWENHGRRCTQVLAESGVSPAANAIESEGWYIPDVMQLYKLYASVAYLSPAFESYGGNISSLCTRSHWSSTIWRDPSEKAYSIASNMRLESVSGMTAKYVRLVRDFPDTASVQAYWTDSRSSGDTVVSPSVTTSYGAVAVYRSDTLSLAANVTVFWPASDTLYETVYTSPQPYTSQLSDLFDDLDISLPGDYEYRDTLQTVHGCDSIVTLLLTVVANVVYSDTLCPLKEDYYFAPFDTVFAAGTVSGVYEHHGTKTVDGVPVDTIAYYELTILPAYEQFDTIGWCLYESSETRRYEGDSRVSITVDGTSVTVSSETEEIVVEEIASVPGTTANFALRMQTVDGCDSVVFLHVDARRVERDTVRHVVSEHQVVDGRVTVSGHTFEDITAAGVYELRDTLPAGNGCDSIVTLLLTVVANVVYSDTLCPLKEDYYFAPFDTVFAAGTVSGVYEHHGTKTVDGVPVDTIAYYELTILPAYEQFDTTGWCLYESSETRRYEGDSRVTITVNGTSVTVSSETEEIVVEEIASVPGTTADFALRMQTVDGCDSVVFLHVDARRVERDTVRHVVSEHQVVDGRITVSGHTFEEITAAGVYELRDTLPAGNGCDSIVTLLLTVSNNVHYSDTLCSLKEDYYFAPFDTVFAAGTVSGVYEHHGTKTVDGVPVDTIAYYELTILPAYEQFDTIGWCLYEPSETRRYEGDSRVTITVNGTSVTVTSETEEIVVEEIASVPGLAANFALRMQTVDGCDSVVFLHVDARRVERDTVRHVVSEHQVVDGRVTVSGHTFEDIAAAGVYELRDTLPARNGCDSIVTLLLTVVANVVYSDTLCPLKEDYYFAPFDTVFAAGTVSGVYEHHGTKTVDGVLVDTIAYYELTILPAYEQFDTTGWCLYESSETRRYEGDSRVTITVNGTSVTVSSETEEIVVEEIASVPGTTADFALRMQTVDGCDSVVFLHVDARRVERDTVRHVVSEHQVVDGRVTVFGHTFEGITAAGAYELRDTLTAGNGCDSIVTLLLTVSNNVHYSDTLCSLKEDHYFAPFDTVFAAGTVSGVYEHHGTKTVDGVLVDTIAYYELTILPAYEQFDTTGWCLYESSETRRYEGDSRVTINVNGTSVTVSSETEEIVVEEIASVPGTTADFALRMQTVDGCDSVVFLHVDARRVERDTVRHVVSEHQVVDGRVTVSGHTFEGIIAAGAYELRDTLPAGNGCDSIVTLLLTVVANVVYSDTLCPLKEDYYFAPFDTVFAAGTVSGVYEHHGTKTVDGVPVDTIAYYELTILPAYEQFDTTGWCLYESSETRRYEGDSRVTITVNGTSVTVSSETEEIVVEEIASVPGTTADFALRMQTVDGCDSVVFLHVDARRVERDTVRHVVSEHQVVDGRVTVSGHTFEDISAAGVYELRDTLTAGNGCDSIEVYELTVTPCVSDFSILCPPDVYDTLAYGDCVMTIYPERLGTPTALYDGEWPFLISNDIPADYLFAQGDNVVTWTATDPECGNSVTCEQHVVIAFPQCPDAVDYEGNVYHGVRIGCNCWTQRNLESTKYSDGAEIVGRYAYANLQYPDTSANVAVFGRLYSFEAAVRDSVDNGHGHIQGICPDGWFLPTPEHYESLNEYGTSALRSPNLWIVGAGDNSTGFTALPAGFYNGQLDRYEGLLTETYFWSTKDVGSSVAKHVYAINYYCDAVVEQHPSSGLGFSVRCIKEK